MSDAMTDIASDQRRGRLYGSYLEALKAFLTDPIDENRDEVIKMAEETDSVRHGYFGGQTSLSRNVEATILKLQEGDKDIWAKFLFSLRDQHNFAAFKSLSPFADKLLISVDYGIGFVRFHGELEHLATSIIRDGKGWKINDADKYVLAIDMPNTDDAEVFWVNKKGGIS